MWLESVNKFLIQNNLQWSQTIYLPQKYFLWEMTFNPTIMTNIFFFQFKNNFVFKYSASNHDKEFIRLYFTLLVQNMRFCWNYLCIGLNTQMVNFTRDKHDCWKYCGSDCTISHVYCWNEFASNSIFIENRTWNHGVTPGVRSESAKCLFKVSSLSNWFCYHMSIVSIVYTIHTEDIQRYRRMCTTWSRIFDRASQIRWIFVKNADFFFLFRLTFESLLIVQ